MVAFLEGQIEFLGKQVAAFPRDGETVRLREHLDEAVSLAVEYFNRLRTEAERALPPNGWREEIARQFVPRYQHWFAMAEKTMAFLREAKALGVTTPHAEAFMFAYLEAKSVARDFDKDLESFQKFERGEHPPGRPVQEQLDELLREHRADGR